MDELWIKVAEYSQVAEEDTFAVEHDGQKICIYKLEGQIFATDNLCSHGDAELSDGLILDGCMIECPLHEGVFDIRTGEAVKPPCIESVRCHEVKVEANSIFLRARNI